VTHQLLENGLNPALVFRDYLTNEIYGKGISSAMIANINASADICDVTNYDHDASQGGSRSYIERYQFAGILDTDKSIKNNVNEILFSMFGHLPWIAGTYTLRLEEETFSSSYDFDDTNITGAIEVSDAPIKSYANKIVYAFTDNSENFQKNTITVESATYLAADNNIVISQNVSNPHEINKYRAENHAETLMKKSRQQIGVKLKASKADALQIECGDGVTLTRAEKGWVSKQFIVVDIKIDKYNDVDLTLGEYESTAYSWAAGVEQLLPNDSVLGTPYSCAPITLLSLSSGTVHLLKMKDGSIVSRIFGDFSHAADAFVDHYDILSKRSTDTNYELRLQVKAKDDSEFYITPAEDGVQYNVRVYAVNTLGVRSAAVDLNHTVIGKTAIPSTPTGLAEGSTDEGVVNLAWAHISDIDLSHYEIHANTTDVRASAYLVGTAQGNTFNHATAVNLYYWIRAIDTSTLVSNWNASAGVLGSPDGFTSDVEWDDILDTASTKPEDNATLGATWDDNIDGDALPDSFNTTDIIYHDWFDSLDRWGLINAVLNDGLKISGSGTATRIMRIDPKYTWDKRRFFSVSFVPNNMANHPTGSYSHFHCGGVPNGSNNTWGFAFKRISGSTMQVYFYCDNVSGTTYYSISSATFTDADNVRCQVYVDDTNWNRFEIIVNGTSVIAQLWTANLPSGVSSANVIPHFSTAAGTFDFWISDYYFHQYS